MEITNSSKQNWKWRCKQFMVEEVEFWKELKWVSRIWMWSKYIIYLYEILNEWLKEDESTTDSMSAADATITTSHSICCNVSLQQMFNHKDCFANSTELKIISGFKSHPPLSLRLWQ